MLRFRRWLGKMQDRLERRAVTLAAGGKGDDRGVFVPLSEADEAMLLDWITGKVDDRTLIDTALARADGLALLERACVVRSANPHVWAARADTCLRQGDLDSALEYSAHAFVLGRFEAEVGLSRVRVLAAAGQRDEALVVLPQALESARRIRAHATRLALCREWHALEPDSIEARLETGRAHVASGAPDEAIAEFERLLVVHGPRMDILMPLGGVYQDLVRLEDAQRIYLQAVELEPDSVDALCMAGQCARDLGEVAVADRCLSRAFELDPRSTFALYNLGVLRFDQGRIAEAAQLLRDARAVNRGAPWTEANFEEKLAQPIERDVSALDWASARFKLIHDIEQFIYLRQHGIVGPALDRVIAEYHRALADPHLPQEAHRMVSLDPRKYPLLVRTYKQPLCAPDPDPPEGSLLNPDLPWAEIEQRYLQSKPNVVVIDDLLSPAALAAVRAYCLESTIWNELKAGYLGAYMPDGFSGRLLLGIAAELRSRLPNVIRQHPLQTMWGYKYDSSLPGTGVHADDAAVNVNFWITPDEANLEPESGGIVVYTHDAPRNWNFQRFNVDHAEIHRYLESVGSERIKVPHRANRAVIFDSDLFHETDAFNFKPGYENRRVNVTLLYGTRAG